MVYIAPSHTLHLLWNFVGESFHRHSLYCKIHKMFLTTKNFRLYSIRLAATLYVCTWIVGTCSIIYNCTWPLHLCYSWHIINFFCPLRCVFNISIVLILHIIEGPAHCWSSTISCYEEVWVCQSLNNILEPPHKLEADTNRLHLPPGFEIVAWLALAVPLVFVFLCLRKHESGERLWYWLFPSFCILWIAWSCSLTAWDLHIELSLV